MKLLLTIYNYVCTLYTTGTRFPHCMMINIIAINVLLHIVIHTKHVQTNNRLITELLEFM